MQGQLCVEATSLWYPSAHQQHKAEEAQEKYLEKGTLEAMLEYPEFGTLQESFAIPAVSAGLWLSAPCPHKQALHYLFPSS